MANPTELANKARTTLAQALQALQSAPDVPETLMEIAEPIAQTMGILHRIEKSGTANVDECTSALDNVRGALDALQGAGEHPAVDAAMEAVAGSLSKLFALAKSVSVSRPPPAPANLSPRPAPASVPKPAAPIAVPPPSPAASDLADLRATIPIQDRPKVAHPVLAGTTPEPAAARPADRVAGMTDAPIPSGSATHTNVELGAHSGSNFYKGLSGNDVIDHGGIFVATYVIPKVGDAVALRIWLPGDLEFESDAIVTFVRETRSGESEPGFGAKFVRISDDGRQLVYRYVRNREPMFYDDL
jgi:hypothetical protein